VAVPVIIMLIVASKRAVFMGMEECRGADKSLARSRKKQANVSVRMV